MLGVLIAELAELEVMPIKKADDKVFSHHCKLFLYRGKGESVS